MFEAVIPNGSTLHICIQFSMLHFLAEQLMMLILCSYRSCVARISRASSNEALPLQLLPCKTEHGEGTFGLICCTRQGKKKRCYAATQCHPYFVFLLSLECRGQVVSQDVKVSIEWSLLCEEGCLVSFSCSHPILWTLRVAVVFLVVV